MAGKTKSTTTKVAAATKKGVEPPVEQRTNPADKVEGAATVASLPFADEVAARSADNHKPSTDFVKVFVLGPGTYTKAAGFDHGPNEAATRQYAIDSGLWPTADVEHVSTTTHADGVSQVLTYRVAVAPAHRVEPESTHPEVVPEGGSDAVDEAANADASKVDKTEA